MLQLSLLYALIMTRNVPGHRYGTYGETERRKYRQDQYPATGNFGQFTGAKWHDLFAFDGTLDEEATDMGMKALTPKAGYEFTRSFGPSVSFFSTLSRFQSNSMSVSCQGCAYHARGPNTRGAAVATD